MKKILSSMVLVLLISGVLTQTVIMRNPGCNAFDEKGVCKSCSPIFYKDPNNICQPVNPNCKTYDQTNGDCLSCYPGFGRLEGTCLPGIEDVAFDSNCNQFIDNVCVKCSFRYYFDQNNKCIKVSNDCASFNQKNGDCTRCYPSFILFQGRCIRETSKPTDPSCNQFDANNNCIKCSLRYYFMNGKCTKIDDSCKDFDIQNKVCKLCYTGYVLNSEYQCVEEKMKQNPNPLCSEWNGSTCVKCSRGSAFDRNGMCLLQDANCRNYDGLTNECKKCYTGYMLQEGVCKLDTVKNLTDPNCNSFSNDKCIKCSTGYYFDSTKACVKIDDLCRSFSLVNQKCMECYAGYQLNLLSQCVQAVQFLSDANCAQWNASQCVKCSFGAFFDAQQKCVVKDPQCKQYDSGNRKCKACYDGYQLNPDQTACIVLAVKAVADSNCAQWSQDICLRCSPGSFFASNGKCQQLDTQCKTANSLNGDCLQCYDGYVLDNNKKCVRKVEDLSDLNCAQWNGKTCTRCSFGAVFNNFGKCVLIDAQCKQYDQFTGQCKACYVGYILNSQLNCIKAAVQEVKDQLCAKWNQDTCIKCSFGAFFNNQGICESADSLCSDFNKQTGECTKCYQGHSLINGKCEVDTSFTVSDPFCAEFQNSICKKCSKGYYFEKDSKCTAADRLCATFDQLNGRCLSCYLGYMLQAGICVPKPDDARDPYCAIFNPDNSCQKCSKGYIFSTNLQNCQLSNPLCKTINQSGSCTSCYTGYVISGTRCELDKNAEWSFCAEMVEDICVRCSSRTFLNSTGQCEKVSDDCRTYSDFSGECLSCYSGFALKLGNCIKDNIKGGCSEFSPSGECIKCSPSYYLEKNECTAIDSQCAKFNFSSKKCDGCYSGYTLLEGRCQISTVNEQFEVKNCVAYNQQNKCIQCFDRFYLTSNQCKEVSVFCKTYDLISGQCTGCYTTFKLKNGLCVK